MSLRATLWALDEATVDNSASTLVLVALADEADDDGKNCFPSMQRLASRARVTRNTVRDHLTRLEDAGLIRIFRPEVRGRGHFNRYELAVPERGEKFTPLLDETRKGGVSVTPSKAVKGGERGEKGGSLTTHNPLPVTRKETTCLSDEFEAWWKRYPRKDDKKKSKALYLKIRGSGVDAATLDDGLSNYLLSRKVAEGFVRIAPTWLRNENWCDEYDPAVVPSDVPAERTGWLPAYIPDDLVSAVPMPDSMKRSKQHE